MATALLCELLIEAWAVEVCAALVEVSECELLAVLLSAAAAVRFCSAFAAETAETVESAGLAVEAPDQPPT
jgi:hypothetical protein